MSSISLISSTRQRVALVFLPVLYLIIKDGFFLRYAFYSNIVLSPSLLLRYHHHILYFPSAHPTIFSIFHLLPQFIFPLNSLSSTLQGINQRFIPLFSFQVRIKFFRS